MNSNLRGFDMDDFVRVDNENKIQSLKHLKKANYWNYFEILTEYYLYLFQDSNFNDGAQEAQLEYFANCSVNLIKGTKNLLGGHFTDSSIFIRKTVEAIRCAAFIRDNSDVVKYWVSADGKIEFDKQFKAWFHDGVGKVVVEAEFSKSGEHYKKATTYGPHSSPTLFAQQHIETDAGFKVLYTEITNDLNGYHNLLSVFFWHLYVHAEALNWWINKSSLKPMLSEDQLRRFYDCQKAIEIDYGSVMRRMMSTTHQSSQKKDN